MRALDTSFLLSKNFKNEEAIKSIENMKISLIKD